MSVDVTVVMTLQITETQATNQKSFTELWNSWGESGPVA
jgi:hypothetical protein